MNEGAAPAIPPWARWQAADRDGENVHSGLVAAVMDTFVDRMEMHA